MALLALLDVELLLGLLFFSLLFFALSFYPVHLLCQALIFQVVGAVALLVCLKLCVVNASQIVCNQLFERLKVLLFLFFLLVRVISSAIIRVDPILRVVFCQQHTLIARPTEHQQGSLEAILDLEEWHFFSQSGKLRHCNQHVGKGDSVWALQLDCLAYLL